MSAQSVSCCILFLCITAGNAFPNAQRPSKRDSTATSQVTLPLYIAGITRVWDQSSLRDYDDELYQVALSIGTPAANFNLTLDSHDDANDDVGNVLFAKKYRMVSDNGFCKDDQPKRHTYHAKSSSSAHIVGPMGKDYPGPLPTPYSSITCADQNSNDEVIKGEIVSDNVGATGKPVNAATFNVIKEIASLNGDWISDGILQYSSRLNLSDVSVLHLLGGASAEYVPPLGGHLILGGKDTAGMCDEKWVTVSDTDKDLLVKSITIGTNPFPIGSQPLKATVSVATSYIVVNYKTHESIIKAVGADYDFQTENYFVYCSEVPSLPDIELSIGGADGSHTVTYRLPGSMYTRKTRPEAEKCLLMFDECDSFDDDCASGKVWRLGSTFLRPYCHLMQKSGDKWTYSISNANV